MVKRSTGLRARTRQKLRGGRFSIAERLQNFREGERVVINLNPSVHKGMPHQRYQGVLGRIIGSRGSSYLVEIKDHEKTKCIISRPEHLRGQNK